MSNKMVKIEHPGTGGVGYVPEENLEFWRKRGYVAAGEKPDVPPAAESETELEPEIAVTVPGEAQDTPAGDHDASVDAVNVQDGPPAVTPQTGTAAESADTTSNQGRRFGSRS